MRFFWHFPLFLIFLLGPPQFFHVKLKFFMQMIYFVNDKSFHFVQYGIIFMNEIHQNGDLKTSFWDWWPNDWSSFMDKIKCKSWEFSRYMINCDITDSTYSFDRNLATVWVGVNWYFVGFFLSFDLLVQR